MRVCARKSPFARLATTQPTGNIGCMLRRFGRIVVTCVVMGLLYTGPVAACICVGEPMPDMRCCPDEPQGQDQTTPKPTNLASHTSCAFVPADLLPSSSPDLPTPIAITFAPLPEWSPRAPPSAWSPASPEPHDSPPIYLVTLRLRV